MLTRIAHRLWRKARHLVGPRPASLFPLCPPLPLPTGVSEADLLAFLQSVRPAKAPIEEMARYCGHDFKRFVYTFGLIEEWSGPCLELGANPYFTTMLLRRFSRAEWTLANYFGPQVLDKQGVQQVVFHNFETHQPDSIELRFHHFNVEEERFPFEDGAFAGVLFCEIIEHLLVDPLAALREIKRVLKPDGVLVLTTPNVNRLENVARMLAGQNIYDPYSGYGPYGRHNREYNRQELTALLEHAGFRIERLYSADVHENRAGDYFSVHHLAELLSARTDDLGQYLFVKARNHGVGRAGKPAWLYRSYPANEIAAD